MSDLAGIIIIVGIAVLNTWFGYTAGIRAGQSTERFKNMPEQSAESRKANAVKAKLLNYGIIDRATRYCPMCNRVTAIVQEVDPPFLVRTCLPCGHIHGISCVMPINEEA